MFHDVPKSEEKKFFEIIENILKNHNIITPEEFLLFKRKQYSLLKRSVLITFDDGFYSNYEICKKLQSVYGVTAICFIVSDFMTILNESDAIQFTQLNIYPRSSEFLERTNMQKEHILEIVKLGHSVGSHSKRHKNLSKCSLYELHEEINNSKNDIESFINCEVKSFAYPFGLIEYISQPAFKVAKLSYEYIYSGVRGFNYADNRNLIFRDPISLDEPSLVIEGYINGKFDFLYKKDRNKLLEWLI